jgi:hypothetical protein
MNIMDSLHKVFKPNIPNAQLKPRVGKEKLI